MTESESNPGSSRGLKGPRTYFDTNVIVAALVRGHPHHEMARPVFDRALMGGLTGVTSNHALAEVYSVLTKTPFVPRINPTLAWELLSATVIARFETTELSASEYKQLIEAASRRSWPGGLVFDFLHLAAARKAKCARLLTFNLRQFRMITDGNTDWISAPGG